MKPSEVSQAVQTCIDSGQPVCLWGPPGIGKSQIVAQIATARALELRDVRAVTLDPVDLRGLPTVLDGRSHWAVPDFWPSTGQGILLLDELNRAPQLVQNACLQLVQDRRIGDYTLPDGWNVVAACNDADGGISKMSSALTSRFLHLDVETDLADWCKWAVLANIEPAVIAFVRFRPELLHQFDRSQRSFPCPRTWEFVSRITGKQPNKSTELAMYQGTIGQGAGIEYYAFLQLYRNLPSIDAILLDPAKAPVPVNDVATLYAIATALARRADVNNFRRVLQYLDRMPQEYGVMAVKDAVTRNSALSATAEFTKWAVTHSDVVL